MSPSIRAWSASDYDGDGLLEYAYLRGDTSHLQDPVRGIDTALAVLPLTGGGAIIWGETSTGHPLVAISTQVVSNPSSDYTAIHWDVSVFDLMSGQKLLAILGGPDPFRPVYGYPSSTATSLALYQEQAWFDDTPHVGYRWYSERILLLGRDWTPLETLWISDMRDYTGPHVYRWLACFASGRSEQDDLTHFLTCLTSIGTLPWTTYGHHAGTAHWDWKREFSWNTMAPFAFDLDRNGMTLWIEPLRDGSGWQRRDFATGSIVDTLHGMPSIPSPLTGALFTAGVSDLFYIADSALYVWVPGSYGPSSSVKIAREASPEEGIALHAAPNPSNSGVRLSWSGVVKPARLEIFNILGQQVQAFDLTTVNPSADIVWDGTDAGGRTVPSGVYFARLVERDRSATVKIVLLK